MKKNIHDHDKTLRAIELTIFFLYAIEQVTF